MCIFGTGQRFGAPDKRRGRVYPRAPPPPVTDPDVTRMRGERPLLKQQEEGMIRSRIALILACTLGIVVGAMSAGLLNAQPKQEYRPKAETKKLVETALHGVQGKKVSIMHFKLPPGYVGGKHYHTGPVFVYIAKGTLTVDETGKSQQKFSTGQLYVEPIGTTMVGRNVNTKESAELVVFQVHGEGEPLMYKAD